MSDSSSPLVLPVVPLRETVVFPGQAVPLAIEREASIATVEEAARGDRNLALFTQKDPAAETPKLEELHPIGCTAQILKLLKHPEGMLTVIVRGSGRIRAIAPVPVESGLRAEVENLADTDTEGISVRALQKTLSGLVQRLFGLMPMVPEEMKAAFAGMEDPSRLADMAAAHLDIRTAEKISVLETLNVRERLERVTQIVQRETEVLELGSKIQKDVQQQMDKRMREHYLREQLAAIRRELGEDDEEAEDREIRELSEKLEASGMPAPVLEEAKKELKRLASMNPASAEYTVARTYMDWMTALPWAKEAEERIDLPEVRRVLDEDHYDLERLKDRILEHLSVLKRNPGRKGPILCFVGPPGTGKTSLARSIARALNRPFQRISLGGIHDEAEIRGHRRTYVGALPGRILQVVRKAGVRNLLLCLDEVDKLGADFRGDPSSALLEVLDPEQNDSFTDHYLAQPFDLSRVMFITTANQVEPIPGPLRDRMEILEQPGYTPEDKVRIARIHLLPRQRKDAGLTEEEFTVPDEVLSRIATVYTHEAGLRNMEREIAALCRKAARKLSEGAPAPVSVTLENLDDFLGPPRHFPETAERTSVPGVATGLAWTAAGGDILFIEATRMRGHGHLTLTGSLGDVMKESAQAALSYLRANAEKYGIPADFLETADLHIHVPAGAIPKDGPSAGVTLATALASLLLDRPCRPDVAMTGEITLRGKVLPVGGIKEKVLAARRAGIRTVVLPERNRRDLEEVSPEQVAGMEFRFAESLDVVLEAALLERKAVQAHS